MRHETDPLVIRANVMNYKRCSKCGRRKPRSVAECEAFHNESERRTCWTGWGCIDPECDYLALCRKDVTIARLRAELAKAPRWVPVTERMPERPLESSVPMVVTTGEDGTDFGFWTGERWLGSDGTTRGVTHWLAIEPIP